MSFAITDHKGIRIRFENGWTVSIQFGFGNYCEHHNSPIRDFNAARKADLWESAEAETALISPEGKFVEYDGSEVQGYRTPAQVAALIAFAAARQ